MQSVEQALEGLSASPCPVALEGPLGSAEAFLRRVAGWRAAVEASGARRVALFAVDRAEFSAALFGGWLAQAEVVLPGDALPRTVTALEGRCDAFLGDFPQALHPLDGPLPAKWAVSPDARMVVFTSGTTGAPAAIDKRLAQLSAEVSSLEATFHPGAVAVISTVSHQHIYGLLFTVLWPLAARRPFLPRRLEYPEEVEAALAQQAALLVTSPAHLKRLPERAAPLSLPHRPVAVFSSGGPLPEEGARRCRAMLGVSPVEVYGSSETGGVAFRQRDEGPLSPFEPLPGVAWQLGEGGVLLVRSAHLWDDGWYVTADSAQPSGDGRFVLGPRADRVAKVEEKRVSLTAVEGRLKESGLLVDARAVLLEGARVTVGVLGVPSERGRAVLARGKRALVEELKAALADTVERVVLPRRFRFVDELPVTAEGKTTDAAVLAALAPFAPEASWLVRAPDRAVLTFEVDPALRVLQGHFPQVAVVPGVAQVDWAVEWMSQAFSLTPPIDRIEVLKFQALMRPGHRVTLELTCNRQKSTGSFRYQGSEGAPFSSGRVVFRPR